MNLLKQIDFKNKNILIAPHSPMTNALKTTLEEENIKILGFLDKQKEDKNIYKYSQIKFLQVDIVVILSPNHFLYIYEECLKYIDSSQIINVQIENSEYIFSNKTNNSCFRKFTYFPQDIHTKREKFVFICKDFIGSNNKAFFNYCYRQKIQVAILTDNEEQIKELENLKLPFERLDTPKADYEIAIAKYIVFDQANYTYLPPLHQEQKTIQLWHGVGLKKMSKLENITYDYFISTSNWTNETNFKNIFDAKHFLNFGYPRNDILNANKNEDYLDLLFCDKKIYNFIINESNKKIILYAPTHREKQTSIKLDFELFNECLKLQNSFLVVKLHPFVLKFYKIDTQKSYSNILFHNVNGDVYPILKYIDILISDYSSIVYDYLLLDRPIIFFDYDIEQYIKNVPFLFDYYEYSPGLKVQTQNELFKALFKKDTYSKERKIIKNRFFSNGNLEASKAILDTIIE